MKSKNLILFLSLILFSGVVVSSISFTGYKNNVGGNLFNVDQSACGQGTDFIIQIDPLGCSPMVVRSDLLEDQDTHVICEVKALKLNPLIKIESIRGISFGGKYPPEVRNVAFYPSDNLRSRQIEFNDFGWETIGHVSITLRQKPESQLTNCESGVLGEVCWVSGDLLATLNYDIQNAFGLNPNKYYLPELSDSEFSYTQGYYSFFNGRGYLRAEDIQPNSAVISIYSGLNRNYFWQSSSLNSPKTKLLNFRLEEGQTYPNPIFLPGYECLAGVKIKLDEIVYADTTALLSINSQLMEFREGDKFLNDKCRVKDIYRLGFNQRVIIYCDSDDAKREIFSSNEFTLRLNPRVAINISDGNSRNTFIAGMGQKLYEYQTEEGLAGIYLGFIDLKVGSTNRGDIKAILVRIPSSHQPNGVLPDYLTESQIENIVCMDEEARNFFGTVNCRAMQLSRWFVPGDLKQTLEFGKSYNFEGKNFEIAGFASGENFPLSKESLSYYNSAIEEFNSVVVGFNSDVYPEGANSTLGERALYEKILLADSLHQKKDLEVFCNEFKQRYPYSNLDSLVCDEIFYSGTEVSSKTVLIEDFYNEIKLHDVRNPPIEDYGARIYWVNTNTNEQGELKLGKSESSYLGESSNNSLNLKEVGEDYAEVSILIEGKLKNYRLKINEPEQFSYGNALNSDLKDSGYFFTLKEVYLERYARISVNPMVGRTQSTTNFSFKVGIEKRAIQLSPEKAKKVADKTEGLINQIKDINDGLGKVVENMKYACFATGGFLAAKNILGGIKGDTLARQEVLRGEEGWIKKCSLMVNEKNYASVEECLLDNSKDIDAEVKEISDAINNQNILLREIRNQDGMYIKNPLGDKIINNKKFVEVYSLQVKDSLDHLGFSMINPKVSSESINLSEVKMYLNVEAWENGIFDIEKIRSIELYSNLVKKNPDNLGYNVSLYSLLKELQINGKNKKQLNSQLEKIKINSLQVNYVIPENLKELPYKGLTLYSIDWKNFNGFPENTPVAYVVNQKSSESFVVLLNRNLGGDIYTLLRDEIGKPLVYNLDKVQVSGGLEEIERLTFKEYDSTSYNNVYLDPRVTYYETEPYKGLPAIVPFNTKKGWYVSIKQTIPVFGEIASYSDSTFVNSFYVCNVGKNGLQEFGLSISDDICQMINLGTGQAYNQFPGLDKKDSEELISNAIKAIEDAKSNYKSGARSVKILNSNINVGSPKSNDPLISCTDFMSPKDCQILFNVCDPVMCPNTRCDFGGAYPVQNVIGSGIIGSLVLCFPNYKEGIIFPICLSGVHAGLDNLISVLDSYQSCLETSVESGQMVGVCDEIYSIYLCEFLWRDAKPLTEIGISKIAKVILNQNVRGGGEYLTLQNAWKNTEDSINYFVNFYGVNSFNAFKARSTDQIGASVCKNFVSVVYPSSFGSLSTLVQPDSPSQFNARFEEIEYSSATVPPMSQYKVYYHIFAGNDQGAYYQVYLKGSEGSSYYQDTQFGIRNVGSGYIAAGKYASETIDFTAASGFKQLCVRINNLEKCGFKQVTSSFAANYLKDQYLLSQSTKEDIKTEKECISGSMSAYNLLNPNIQEGIDNVLNTEVYKNGLIRICSSQVPGNSLLSGRWMEVGYCGDPNIKCWVDTESIKQAAEFEITSDTALKNLTENFIEKLRKEGNYMEKFEFEEFVKEIMEGNLHPMERIKRIDGILSKVYYSNQRGYLYLLKGIAFGDLAKESFKLLDEPILVDPDKQEKEEELPEEEIDKILPIYSYSVLVFEDGLTTLKPNNIMYSFSQGEWFWRIWGENNWKNVSQYINPDLNKRNQDYLNKIKGKNYLEGLTLLIDRTIEDKEGKWLLGSLRPGNTYPDLVGVNNGVNMGHDGIFVIEDLPDIKKIYFRYGNIIRYEGERPNTSPDSGEWLWSYDEKSWKKSGTIEKKISGKKQIEMPKIIESLVLRLGNEKNFYLGSAMIFNYDQFEIEDSEITIPPEEGEEEILPEEEISLEEYDWSSVNSRCINYKDLFFKVSEKTGVPFSILVALSNQESGCNVNAVSNRGAHGITQVMPNVWCGKYGLVKNENDCKNQLLNNPELSIEVGARILLEKYNEYKFGVKASSTYLKGSSSFKKLVDECIKTYPKYAGYTEWRAALRGYNGWGCGSGSDTDYVEKVMNFAQEFVKKSSRGGSNKIATIALREYSKWEYGKLDECSELGKTYLKKYYDDALLSNWDCRGTAWSAAFISSIVKESNFNFPFDSAHARYFSTLRDNPSNYGCKTYRISEIDKIQEGDIICKCREEGCPTNYDSVRSGKSHCDIVVEIKSNSLSLIGGNLKDSVSQAEVEISEVKSDSDYFGFIHCG